MDAIPRLTEVVCVTAAENYGLQPHEAAGVTGWAEYRAADVVVREVGRSPSSSDAHLDVVESETGRGL